MWFFCNPKIKEKVCQKNREKVFEKRVFCFLNEKFGFWKMSFFFLKNATTTWCRRRLGSWSPNWPGFGRATCCEGLSWCLKSLFWGLMKNGEWVTEWPLPVIWTRSNSFLGPYWIVLIFNFEYLFSPKSTIHPKIVLCIFVNILDTIALQIVSRRFISS